MRNQNMIKRNDNRRHQIWCVNPTTHFLAPRNRFLETCDIGKT
jgi:hypothetical protein